MKRRKKKKYQRDVPNSNLLSLRRMALKSTKGDLPIGTKRLTEREVIEYQEEYINKWKPQSDVWPLKYSSLVYLTTTGISATYIHAHFRRFFKLRKYGLFASTVGAVGAPMIFSTILQKEFVLQKLYLPIPRCPVCMEMRSMIIQSVNGVLYPLILTSILNLYLATHYATYRVPYYKEYKSIFALLKKAVKPIRMQLMVLLIFNTIVSSFMVYMQTTSLEYINEKLQTRYKKNVN